MSCEKLQRELCETEELYKASREAVESNLHELKSELKELDKKVLFSAKGKR